MDASLGSHDGGNVARARDPLRVSRALADPVTRLSFSPSHHARARSAPFFPSFSPLSNRLDNRYIRRIISDYAPLCTPPRVKYERFFAMGGKFAIRQEGGGTRVILKLPYVRPPCL